MTSPPPLPEPFVKRIDGAYLTDFCIRALKTTGMSEANARITAEALARTDMRGIYTHGTVSLRRYVKQIHDGGVNPLAVPEFITEGLAWAQFDAHESIGMVSSHTAMQAAIDKAKTTGMGFASVCHSNHFGAASAYSLMAAEQSMIGVAMSNTDVIMSIPGGRGPVLGNNPLSYAVPARNHAPMVLDVAMSTVAGGKVVLAQHRGKPVPMGWITDKDGTPTTDPGVYLEGGALTPIGNYKGYGLALFVETLSSVLSGAAITTDALCWARESDKPCDEGHSFIVINMGAMMPIDRFYDRIDELISRMKNAPKAKGSDRTYVPGEMEDDTEQIAREYGAPLTQLTVDNLIGLSEDVGEPFDI